MKYVRNLLLATLLCSLQPVLADPISGTVYGIYPEGVMVDYGAGSYLVPTQHATFSLGGLSATWSSLQPGQVVNFNVPDPYWGDVVRIPDPYQWKMKHHPNHPHGGPPGQTKKIYNNKGKGNKGKGKWK